MEYLLLLVLIGVLIVLLSVKRSLSDQIRTLDLRLNDLTRILNERKRQDIQADRSSASHPAEASRVVAVPASKTEPEVQAKPPMPAPEREQTSQKPVSPEPVTKDEGGIPWGTAQPPTSRRARPGFFERNPDIEKFIGENLANKIGIAILVLGIGFFVKYAIDRNWINEIGRVFIGIVAGGLLIAIAHRLRKTLSAFSSVLVGGGIAVLYFTIAIAYHEYNIFSQSAAFVLMVVITAFTILLSLGYDRKELAVLGILGGFGSPFMVSDGSGNHIVLFTYMLILNGGMLILAYHKKWRIVNVTCYIFTIFIFGGWLATGFDSRNSNVIAHTLLFATLFYVTFFAMNIVNNVRQRMQFESQDIILLLSNTFLYFSAGMIALNNSIGSQFTGLFTVAVAAFNFVFAYTLYKNAHADRKLVFMLIGLVLTFVSLAAPIQLEGNYITLFWAAEAVLLLWLGQRSGLRLMATASMIVMGLMIVSLMIDWIDLYGIYSGELPILLNKGYITGAVGIVSLALTHRLLGQERTLPAHIINPYRHLLTAGLFLFTYIVHLLELRHQVVHHVDSVATQAVIVGAYNMLCILLTILLVQNYFASLRIRHSIHWLSVVAVAAYLFIYHGAIKDARNEFVEELSSITGFVAHYGLVLLLVAIIALSLKIVSRQTGLSQTIRNHHWWLSMLVFVFLASAELDHTVLLASYSETTSIAEITKHNQRTGYPILWGLASFAMIAVGLIRKIKILRIISLVLFLVTLLKLFLVDLRNISEGGKIAAFICLGILLLIVSFMYQRLKRILLAEGVSNEDQQ